MRGFLRYVIAKYNDYQINLSYQVYMTDLMASLTQSSIRWIDAVHNDKTQEEKNEEEAQKAVNALRENFYRKEEKHECI